MSATFWNRNEHLRPGLLSDADTRTALEKPFAECDIHFESDTLREVIQDTRGYPYFIQVWGDELFDEAKAQNTNNINATIQERAASRVNIKKNKHYKTYSDKILAQEEILPYALHAGELINAADGNLRNDLLIKNINEMGMPADKTALDIISALHNIGYIWQGDLEEEDNWNLAIPSLTDYIREKNKALFPETAASAKSA